MLHMPGKFQYFKYVLNDYKIDLIENVQRYAAYISYRNNITVLTYEDGNVLPLFSNN